MTTDAKPKKNYIDKKAMYDEIVKSNEQGKCTEELGRMFMMLSENYSHDIKFRDYERRYGRAFKEDLVSTGIHACAKAWDKFNPEESNNPFSYFTTCVHRAFIGYLSKEYGFFNTKNALKVDKGMRGDYGYEEMMKEKEEAQKVEDEEAFEIESVDELEDDEEEVESRSTEESAEDAYQKKIADENDRKRHPTRVVYDHLEHMTLWGDEEEVPTEQPSFESTIDSTFGVSK